MVHKIGPDRVVLVRGKGNFEFRADTIHACDQDGILDPAFLKIGTKEAAEAADTSQYLGPVGGTNEVPDAGLEPVAELHINSRARIGTFSGFRGFRFCRRSGGLLLGCILGFGSFGGFFLGGHDKGVGVVLQIRIGR